MCRCAVAAIARAVVAFLEAFLVGCFVSCFRPRHRPGSGSGSDIRDAPAGRDRDGEPLWADEEGFGRSGRLGEDLAADGASIDDGELRIQCDEDALMRRNGDREALWDGKQGLRSERSCEDLAGGGGVHDHKLKLKLEKTLFVNSKHNLGTNASPFPTPLAVRDDMETPGTVYTSQRGVSGKRMRPRKQFIYPVLRPIENKLQQMELLEDSASNPCKKRNTGEDSIKPKQTEGDWNGHVENSTPKLLKTYNDNCIPNTTTKYKEDQKVTWHTTPFEERLLKVLSEEERWHSRKVVRGSLFDLEVDENAK